MALDVIIIGGTGFRYGGGSQPIDEKHSYILGDNSERLPTMLLSLRDYWVSKDKGVPYNSAPPRFKFEKVVTLNGIYLYSFVKRNGFKVDLINNMAHEQERLSGLLKKNPTAMIALSTTFISTVKELKTAVSFLRDMGCHSTIIVGGPFIYKSWMIEHHYHLFSTYRDALSQIYFTQSTQINVDYLVVSQKGEQALCELMRKLKNNENVENVKNILYRQAGKWVYTGFKDEWIDLDKDAEIIDWRNLSEKYLDEIVSLRGSVGCLFNCKFCDFKTFSSRHAIKSTDALLSEFKRIASRKLVKRVFFVDDNIFVKPRSVENFARAVIRNRINLEWEGMIKADFITKDNAKLIKDAGCVLLLFGAESGSQTILRNMNKHITPQRLAHAIELVNLSAIDTILTFIVGFPGETEETLNDTISFINNLPDYNETINHVLPFVFDVLPFSPIDSKDERKKYRLEGVRFNWKHNTMDAKSVFQKYYAEFITSVKYLFQFTCEFDELLESNYARNAIKEMFRLKTTLLRMQITGKENFEERKKLLKSLRDLLIPQVSI